MAWTASFLFSAYACSQKTSGLRHGLQYLLKILLNSRTLFSTVVKTEVFLIYSLDRSYGFSYG